MGPDEDASASALERLFLLRVAKDLFLSQWYAKACAKLFGDRTCAELDRIAEETREEWERTVPLIHRWAALITAHEEPKAPTETVATLSRHDFLRTLIEAKEAAAEVYEKAAGVAPAQLREAFLDLAAIDFKHATQLREMSRAEPQPPDAHFPSPAS